MSKDEKKTELAGLAKSILSLPQYQEEFEYLLSELSITQEEVIQAFITWDLDPDSYGNEFYSSIAARFAMHLRNRAPGAWHSERQHITVELLHQKPFKHLADIGFGVPQQYVREVILKENRVSCILFDLYESARTFAEALLRYWDKDWHKKITLKRHDMNFDEMVGSFDVYLFQDSIEHTHNPASYLKNVVEQAPANARFIFSLPIAVGKHEPSHFIGWDSEADVKEWLEKSGLRVESSTAIKPDLSVDIYARSLDKNYFQLIADCSKA